MEGTTHFPITPEVAARLRCSVRTVHELTRLGLIPHRRLPGSRRCLFREDELQAWEDGAELEIVDVGGSGRLVRPIATNMYFRRSPVAGASPAGPRARLAGEQGSQRGIARRAYRG